MSLFKILVMDGNPGIARHDESGLDVDAGGGLANLTPRELEILALLGKGLDNDEIARASHISRRTAETHVYHIYGKLRVRNRAQAMLYAIRNGLVGDVKP